MTIFTKIETPEEFREVVEAKRLSTGQTFRGMAYAAETAHATYWFWIKKPTAEISLRNALLFAKAVGLSVYIGE
jgi:hypothetical protein